MAGSSSQGPGLRPERIVEFLEATYEFDSDDQTWLARVMEGARAVTERTAAMHGAIYDASDISAFRLRNVHTDGFSAPQLEWIAKGLSLITPAMVARTFRTTLAGMSEPALPEMSPMYDGMSLLGLVDTLYLNGLDPNGRGLVVGLWVQERGAPSSAQLDVYRRLAHHLAAAYRCRRRLRQSQSDCASLDLTEGAAAILDARRRVVHATGAARTKLAQADLTESSKARDATWTKRPEVTDGLRRWRPLTAARWTLVDSFDRGGARYIVARENCAEVRGLMALTERERQVIAYAALEQSPKETAYALGIADSTVRVLLSRARTKLGAKSHAELLDHPEVRALRPGGSGT